MNTQRIMLCLSTIGFLLSTSAAYCDTGVLSLESAAIAAYGNSPDIRAARENLKSVQELYPQARANWHPRVTLSAGVTAAHISDDPSSRDDGGFAKDVTLSVDQPLYRGGRSEAQDREAQDRINAGYANLLSSEQEVMSRAMIAGINIAYANKNLALLRRNEENYQKLSDIVGRRREGGEATETDIALANTKLQRAMADRINAENTLSDAKSAYEEITGIFPDDWSDATFPALSLPQTEQEAVDRAKEDNADIRAAQFLSAAEQNRIGTVKGELLPQVTVSASYSYQWDPLPGTLDSEETEQVGIRASMPLYEGGAIRSRVRQVKNDAAKRQYDRNSIVLSVEKQALAAYRAQTSAQNRMALHDKEAIAAEQARHNMEAEVFAGEKTLIDLLQTDQDWLEAHAASITAWRDHMTAKTKLAALLTMLMPENLGYQGTSYDPRRYVRAVESRLFSTSVSME